ncbi:hypothetical protein G7046_g5585 [Stylonectria norvegica]|nr:hypothetical protein G7046_g5585 [Stylonectria norvegica]
MLREEQGSKFMAWASAWSDLHRLTERVLDSSAPPLPSPPHASHVDVDVFVAQPDPRLSSCAEFFRLPHWFLLSTSAWCGSQVSRHHLPLIIRTFIRLRRARTIDYLSIQLHEHRRRAGPSIRLQQRWQHRSLAASRLGLWLRARVNPSATSSVAISLPTSPAMPSDPRAMNKHPLPAAFFLRSPSLSLLPMPSHAVTPPPSNFDSNTVYPNYEDPSANRHFSRHVAFPYQRSFPIRTSQPPRIATTSSASLYPPHTEHHLRRKTPNGTIEAGYDGSPSQPSQGPPPLKHVILPRSMPGNSYPSAPPALNHLRHHLTVENQSPSPSDLGLGHDGRRIQTGPPSWPTVSNMILGHGTYQTQPKTFLPPGGQYQYQPSAQLDTAALFPSVYQPVMRPNEYNVRAFCPPPGAVNECLPLGQLPMQPISSMVSMPSSPWGSQTSDRHGLGSSKHPRQPYFRHDSGDLLPVFMVQQSFHKSQVPEWHLHPTQPTHISFQPSEHDLNASDQLQFHSSRYNGFNGQTAFREKVLSQAHRSYLDLLAYLQTMRRSHFAKSVPGTCASPKLLVYPKPPRPTGSSPANSFQVGEPTRLDTSHIARANYPQAASPHRSDRLPYVDLADYHGTKTNPSYDSGACFTDVSRGRDYHHGGNNDAPYPSVNFNASVPSGKMSPLANAQSCLDVLNTLCEQSGWNWIDGMLLGGCLHYGLEHYGEALEWFSRIITLDSSHVEAITNMAATLYCLNRQDEAEQHWLRAVKVRPSYLEAAEHLVGLLYRKRSREAVEIINYVQQALRLSPPRSTQTSQTSVSSQSTYDYFLVTPLAHSFQLSDTLQTPAQLHPGAQQRSESKINGFGSSGYAIPGRENGRIVALIHAKGTMLYNLKQVGGALKAFEEAVLISAGRRMSGIQDLVRRVQAVLSPAEGGSSPYRQPARTVRPQLLPPERARQTAHLVFGGSGELPGLRYVAEGTTKRAAVQTTSNSLLSLAKIFQDAMSTGAAGPELLGRPFGVGDILALYYLSLSLQESPSTANNVGILLAGVQQPASSLPCGSTAASSQPSIPGIMPGSGLALALAYYHYGLRLDPKHVHLHTNLGSLLKDIGQLDLAIQMYEQAVSCDGAFDIALTNLANAVKDRGRISDAIAYYKRAVSSNPDFAEAVCGLSTALNSVCDWRGRGGVVLEPGKYDRWHVDDKGLLVDAHAQGRGSGLTRRVVQIVGRQVEEASHWGRGVLDEGTIAVLAEQVRMLYSSTPPAPEAALRKWAGKAWEGSRVVRLVERATRVAQRKWYRDRYVSRVEASSPYIRPRLQSSLTVPAAPTVLPFHTFTCPLTARDIRVISQRNAIRISCSTLRLPWIPATVYPPPPPPTHQLNIGYVSSDFNNHPLAHLMQSVFGLHDPRRARAFCYATTAGDKSIHRQKIEREAPVFRDVSSWPAEKLVEQIVRDEIHILVNLNGYTRGARNEVFAARPAPIQMSFMGFAGTLGAEWCDYILADSTAIPAETLRPWRSNVSVEDVFHDDNEAEDGSWMYSENIIFCRDTFFCCDHAQSCDAGERKVTWVEEQRRRWKMRKELFPTLPDDGIILGNFNQLYKIEPTTFRSWLRILARAPKAILWLLRFPELGEVNLRRTAKAWAGSEVASRIVFTDVAPKHQHISRARVCDLFLDTPECNAHTTAADVLWSSTPLLTLPRYPYKMCSRMAASILKGALPKSDDGRQAATELIVANDAEYEQMAVRLASGLSYGMKSSGYGEGHGRLAEMRKLLWDNKWQCGLFDTKRWVNDVEMAYEEAWRRWVAGEGGDIYLYLYIVNAGRYLQTAPPPQPPGPGPPPGASLVPFPSPPLSGRKDNDSDSDSDLDDPSQVAQVAQASSHPLTMIVLPRALVPAPATVITVYSPAEDEYVLRTCLTYLRLALRTHLALRSTAQQLADGAGVDIR